MINPVIYTIDYLKLLQWQLAYQLRLPKMIAWLNIVVSPVIYVYQLFLKYRKNKLYELSITPQVCRMEALLNDSFDFTLRRIYIDDALEYPPLYLYQDAELKPVYLYQDSENAPQYLFTDGESAALADDFIIFVPVALVYDSLQMRSLVKNFKLPGMKFKIQTY